MKIRFGTRSSKIKKPAKKDLTQWFEALFFIPLTIDVNRSTPPPNPIFKFAILVCFPFFACKWWNSREKG